MVELTQEMQENMAQQNKAELKAQMSDDSETTVATGATTRYLTFPRVDGWVFFSARKYIRVKVSFHIFGSGIATSV